MKKTKVMKVAKKTMNVSRGLIVSGILVATGMIFSNEVYSRIKSVQPRVLGESAVADYTASTGGDSKNSGTSAAYVPSSGGDVKNPTVDKGVTVTTGSSNYVPSTSGDNKNSGANSTYIPSTGGDNKNPGTSSAYVPSSGGDVKSSTGDNNATATTGSASNYVPSTSGDSKNSGASASNKSNNSSSVKASPYVYKNEGVAQVNGNSGTAYNNTAGDLSKNNSQNNARYIESVTAKLNDIKTDLNAVGITINTLAANGVDTSSFIGSVKEIQELVAAADSKNIKNPTDAESIFRNAGSKLIQLEHVLSAITDGASDVTNKDASASAPDIALKINDLESQLRLLSGDAKSGNYQTLMDSAKNSISQAKEKMNSGSYVDANISAKTAEKKIGELKETMGSSVFVGDSKDMAASHKNTIAQFVKNLTLVAQSDDAIGKQISAVALSQDETQVATSDAIDKINNMSGFAKFFLGSDYKSVAVVNSEIDGNKVRLNTIDGIIAQTNDQSVRIVLQDQSKLLQQENSKLITFVNDKENVKGVFGWFMKLIS